MSIDKIKNFNRKMARPKFAKGGYVKRKKFAAGGGTEHTMGEHTLGVPLNPVTPPLNGPGNPTNTNSTGAGGLAQGLGLNAASANIQPGTNATQLNNAYTGANNAINAQVGLTNTLTPQAATGVNAQNQVLQNQLDIARGAGPNPALAQLNQATGTNVANEAALLSGQRGSNSNVGLAGRNIGVAGANNMQGAAGQAATLEAEQQIAANQNAANVAANQVNQAQGATTNLNTAQQNEQNILQGANTAANNAAVGMQSNINGINAAGAGKALGAGAAGVGGLLGGLGVGGFAEGGQVHHGKHKLDFIHKMAKMGMEHYDSGGDIKKNPLVNDPNNQTSQTPVSNYTAPAADVLQVGGSGAPASGGGSGGGQDPLGGLVGGLGKTVGGALKDFGSTLWNGLAGMGSDAAAGATSVVPAIGADAAGLWAGADTALPAVAAVAAHGGQIWNVHPSEHDKYIASHVQNYFAGGGKVPALVSPGEVYLNPEQVNQVKQGADPLQVGQRVPGKAKVKGDSYKNDFVKAELDEGGVVVDRENVGNPKKARKFVLKSISKRHLKKPGKR
jgi:hypothetical protein